MDLFFIPHAFHDVSIDELGVSVRLYNVLRSLGLNVLGELSSFTPADILRVRNCGKKTLHELMELVGQMDEGGDRREELCEVPRIPAHLRDLPIKLICEGEPLGSFLVSRGIRKLGDLESQGKAFYDSVQKKYGIEYELVCNRVRAGEYDRYLSADQRSDVKAIIVRSLHGPLRVPEAIHELKTEHIGASVRLSNVLEAAGVKTLSELQEISFEQLKSAANCGTKSIFELWSFLMESSKPRVDDGSVAVEQNTTVSPQLSFVGLLEVINEYVEGIPQRDRMILLARFGGIAGQKPRTLEEIGQDYSVTRERIRQIEKKHLRRLARLTAGRTDQLFGELIRECETEICLLTAELLILKAQENYSSFLYPPIFYLSLFRELAPSELPILGSRDGVTQARIDRVQPLVREIKSLLLLGDPCMTLAEVWNQILDRRLVAEHGMSAFFDAVQSDSFRLDVGDTPLTLLISVKKLSLTSGQITLAILSESSVPLTPEQIIDRAVQRFGPELELPSPNSLANLPGYDSRFYLLDRRCLGLLQHFRLASEHWEGARTDFFDVLKSLGRPVSTNEIFSDFRFDWAESSTPNELAAILREDPRFVDLGRLLFSLAEWQMSSRESAKDVISKVLSESDRPLRGSEIVERVRLYRSFSATSLPAMLRDHEQVVEIGFGYYGLKANAPYTDFLCSDALLLKRVVRKYGPISLKEILKKLDVPPDAAREQLLRSALESIPEIRLSAVPTERAILASFHRVFPRKQ